MKRVSFRWVIVAFVAPMIAWGLTLIFGQVARWESSPLDLDKVRMSLEIREKMNRTLEEILNMDSKNQALWEAKVGDFNAAEKNLARLEGRSPVFYKIPATPVNVRLSMEKATPNNLKDEPMQCTAHDVLCDRR